MGRIVGWVLIALAAFMFIGYLGADVAGATAVFALLITVVLPAAGGIALVTGRVRGRKVGARREELRQQTVEAELLRLAGRHGGKLTIVEAVGDLAITPEEAKQALDALSVRGLADFEVTDSGIVVYVFHDVQNLGDKPHSRGLLE
ncbi:MAG TPA: hypothetical protein VHG09_10120 [Longimicrobiales bacterium]|nr:hypothetical protein [Longimicrobiales bacterium]